MKRLQNGLAQAALMLVLGSGGAALAEDDPCSAFTWNVSHEHNLFAGKPSSEKAGAAIAAAPVVKVDRLYELGLTAQDQVHFQAPPGKAPRTGGTYAGLVKLNVAKPGLYRISVDQPFWIDVATGPELLHSTDYEAAVGCSTPHKIVQFVLPAAQDLVVQISGMQSPQVLLTVTFAPATQ